MILANKSSSALSTNWKSFNWLILCGSFKTILLSFGASILVFCSTIFSTTIRLNSFSFCFGMNTFSISAFMSKSKNSFFLKFSCNSSIESGAFFAVCNISPLTSLIFLSTLNWAVICWFAFATILIGTFTLCVVASMACSRL